MRDITKNEIMAVLTIVKSPEIMYNANSLSKGLGISSMGTLKILKRLETESILKSRQIGKSNIYKVNTGNNNARNYIKFLLSRESSSSSSFIKRWITEIKKIKHADIAMLFGSVLKKTDVNDIDVLFVTEQRQFKKLKAEINKINEINIKKIHPIYQTCNDLVRNIGKRDRVVLNAMKGIVVFGEERFLEVYDESCGE